MARRCELSGKSVLSGNNVSHAHNKTRRKFFPNLQNIHLRSDLLNQNMKFSMCTSLLRTVERCGGLDAWLSTQPERNLATKAVKIKRAIAKIQKNSQIQPENQQI